VSKRLVGKRLVGNRVVGNRVVGKRLVGKMLVGNRVVANRVVGKMLVGNTLVGNTNALVGKIGDLVVVVSGGPGFSFEGIELVRLVELPGPPGAPGGVVLVGFVLETTLEGLVKDVLEELISALDGVLKVVDVLDAIEIEDVEVVAGGIRFDLLCWRVMRMMGDGMGYELGIEVVWGVGVDDVV